MLPLSSLLVLYHSVEMQDNLLDRSTNTVFLEITRYLCTPGTLTIRMKKRKIRRKSYPSHLPSNLGCHGERTHRMSMAFQLDAELRPKSFPRSRGKNFRFRKVLQLRPVAVCAESTSTRLLPLTLPPPVNLPPSSVYGTAKTAACRKF